MKGSYGSTNDAAPNSGEPKNWIIKLIVAAALTTVVSTTISTTVTLRTSCREKLIADQQQFFRLGTEIDQRVNTVAFGLVGDPISRPRVSDEDILEYLKYFSTNSPEVVSDQFKDKSFDNMSFEMGDIAARWYRDGSYWSNDAMEAGILHPVFQKLQHARGLRSYLLTYSKRHEAPLLGYAADEARKFLNFPVTWENDGGKSHEIRELGGNCYPWPTVYPRQVRELNSHG